MENTYGVVLSPNRRNDEHRSRRPSTAAAGLTADEAQDRSSRTRHGSRVVNRLTKAKAETLHDQAARSLGAEAKVEKLVDPQLAQALRPADQPPGDQPDRLQYLRADLLVGHDGPGPLGHPAGQPRPKADVFLGADRPHRQLLPEHPGLRVLPADGRPALSAGNQRDRPFPAQRQPVRLLLLHDDGLPRGRTSPAA